MEVFKENCGKRKNCWLPAFSPFSTMFSTHPPEEFLLLSCIYFVVMLLIWTSIKKLSFGKELKNLNGRQAWSGSSVVKISELLRS